MKIADTIAPFTELIAQMGEMKRAVKCTLRSMSSLSLMLGVRPASAAVLARRRRRAHAIQAQNAAAAGR